MRIKTQEHYLTT